MVTPEGTRRPERPGPRKGPIAALGVATAVIGSMLLWGWTSPEAPEALPTTIPRTTTTAALEEPVDIANFSVDQIATSDPLEWELVASARGHFPVTMILHEDDLYAVTAPPGQRYDVPRGFHVWRSADGVDWVDLGLVMPAVVQPDSLTSTPQGILAIGSAGERVSLWRSVDGETWDEVHLPEPAPGISSSTAVATANDEVIVVALGEYVDPAALVSERFLEHIGLDTLPEGMWIDWVAGLEEVRFNLVGPFDIRLAEATGDDLGLSEAEEGLVRDATRNNDVVRILSTADGGALWRETRIEADWVESLYTMDDGTIVATAYGSVGPFETTTVDGVNWAESTSSNGFRVTSWREGLVGVTGASPWLLLSEDGSDWTASALRQHLPPRLDWWPSTIAGGRGGIATVLVSETYPSGQQPNLQPLRVERSGATFRFDPWGSQITGTSGAKTYLWGPFSPNVETELAEGVVHFLGGEGEVMGTFTIEELTAYQQDLWSRQQPVEPIERHVAMAFSPDGDTWSIQPPPGDMASQPGTESLAITEDRVFALVAESGRWFSVDVGFEIWSAAIP